VRIGPADLTGNGLDDLVVASDFDHIVAIALQTPSGAPSAGKGPTWPSDTV
jgi:hypothetical protein